MKTRKTFFNEKEQISKIRQQLVEYRKQDDRDKFNKLMDILLPEIKEYVENWLSRAEESDHIGKGQYKVEDFIGELYIAAYDHIEEVKEDKRLYVWMLGKANQIMEDKIIDDSFDSSFFKSLNEYVDQERASMDERLTVNDEGEIVLEDSLDATMNNKANEQYRYTVDEIFIDHDDEDIIEKLNNQLKAKDVDDAIRKIIKTSTLREKSIIDLYTIYKLTIIEISQVTKIESRNVQKVISQLQWNIVQLTGRPE